MKEELGWRDDFPKDLCVWSSHTVEERLGFPIVRGHVIHRGSPTGDGEFHRWNYGPNGEIIDLAGDQFNDVPPVYVTQRDDRYTYLKALTLPHKFL